MLRVCQILLLLRHAFQGCEISSPYQYDILFCIFTSFHLFHPVAFGFFFVFLSENVYSNDLKMHFLVDMEPEFQPRVNRIIMVTQVTVSVNFGEDLRTLRCLRG